VTVRQVGRLSHGEAKVFNFERGGSSQQGFLLNYHGRFFAYANVCPHWNVDLDLGDERFFDERMDAIVCRNHGALFDGDTGWCRAGPCAGANLERFEVLLEGDDAVVSVPRLRILYP